MTTALLLVVSWAAGLVAYAGALRGWRSELLSLDNWALVGGITLVAWTSASVLVTLPVLRRLRTSGAVPLAAAGAALAIAPVWLTLAFWAGWHPRHLLSQEAGLLGVLYGTSGAVLALALPHVAPPPSARNK